MQQPLAKRPAGSAGVVKKNQLWRLKRRNVPRALKSKKISKCSLEFIDSGAADEGDPTYKRRLNHVVLRLTLKHALQEGTPYAPADTRSLLIDITEDYFHPGYGTVDSIPVNVLLKTCRYEGPHRNMLKAVDLPLNRNKTVRHFVRVIEASHLDTCGFVQIGENMCGCRDYISQLINQLTNAKVLKILGTAKDKVFANFNANYNGGKMEDEPHPVVPAVFSEHYKYVAIGVIAYRAKVEEEAEEKEEEELDAGEAEDVEMDLYSDEDSPSP